MLFHCGLPADDKVFGCIWRTIGLVASALAISDNATLFMEIRQFRSLLRTELDLWIRRRKRPAIAIRSYRTRRRLDPRDCSMTKLNRMARPVQGPSAQFRICGSGSGA